MFGEFYKARGKRLLDLTAVVGALPVVIPLLGIVWGLVRLRLGGPAIFRQVRPGRGAVPFELLKFRTMTNERDGAGRLLPDAERLTGFGRWLRRTSLDELPELWNVIRGEMSLVGPRPLLMAYLPRYTAEQRRRHDVRPGITGYAQVSGRNAITWEQKFALDVWYVDNVSLVTDIRILALTIGRVASAHGVSQPGSETAEEFMGSTKSGEHRA